MKESIINLSFNKKNDKKLEFEIFSLQDLFYKNPFRHLKRPQRLLFFMIICFTRGRGKHFIDFQSYPYKPGDIFFISKYQTQFFDVKPGNDGFLILFTENFLYNRPDNLNRLNALRIFDHFFNSPRLKVNDEISNHFLRLIETVFLEYSRPNDPARKPILKNYLEILIWQAERIKQTETYSIEGMKSYKLFHDFKTLLEKHFKEYRTVISYAEMLSKSSKSVNNITKQITSITAKQFINERIILEAKRILSSSDFSTKEVTYALGFDEPTNFVKFFKHHTTMTPKQFRDSIQSDYSV